MHNCIKSSQPNIQHVISFFTDLKTPTHSPVTYPLCSPYIPTSLSAPINIISPFIRPLGAVNPHLEEDSSETLDTVRFLFDSEDLLETASAIVDERMCASERSLMMGMIKMKIATPSLSDLMKR